MRRLVAVVCLALAATFIVGQVVSAGDSFELSSKRGGGRLSPASLDLDTCGCPTTFGTPVCERRTYWSLSKSADTGTLTDPDGAPYQFTVSVIEERTEEFISGEGTIVVTNSGEETTFLSSIVVNLEKQHTGTGLGNAPGPSGNNWNVLATAVRNKFPSSCAATAVTCYGELTATEGAFLQIYDPQNNDVAAMLSDFPIMPTQDDDGDGLRDEDPALPGDPSDVTGGCAVIDNDRDGLYDEDPIDFETVGYDDDGDGIIDRYEEEPVDNDGDGLFNEDDPDDDGDGLVDEDGACADGVVIHFRYSFPIAGLGIEGPGDGIVPSEDDLRIDLVATFRAGGRRGGVCSVDVDCDGVADDYVRSIQQRLRFDPPACLPVCDSVTLSDAGATADDPSCVSVTSNSLHETISATGVDGTTTFFQVTGTVSCNGVECGAIVSNTSTLTGDGCEGLISGSPASASFAVECSETQPRIQPGDFLTQTQGGWGAPPSGNNPGSVLRQYFESVFTDIIPGTYNGESVQWGVNSGASARCNSATGGCDTGPCDLTFLKVGSPEVHAIDTNSGRVFLSPYGLYLSSACAVEDFLPQGDSPDVLTRLFVDPSLTSAGVFAGQLTAARINVRFDAAGIRTDGQSQPYPAGTLGTLVFVDGCVHPALVGRSVDQVVQWSDCVISGEPFGTCGVPAGLTVSDLSDALAVLNENFVDGIANLGCLGFDALPKMAAELGPAESGRAVVNARTVLLQNTPNPFNPRTQIYFSLGRSGPVTLTIYDLSGRALRELVQGPMDAGEHSVVWDGQDDGGREVASGVYVYRLQTPEQTESRRMVLLR